MPKCLLNFLQIWWTKSNLKKKVVKNTGSHFSCAVFDKYQQGLKSINDLKCNIEIFDSVEHMYKIHSIGWFFGVYIDETLTSPSLDRSVSFASAVKMSNKTNEVGNEVKIHKYYHTLFEITNELVFKLDKDKAKNSQIFPYTFWNNYWTSF